MLHEEQLDTIVCRELNLVTKEPNLTEWEEMLRTIKAAKKQVRIALVGKYIQLHDAYLSVMEALKHASWALGSQVQIDWIDSEQVTEDSVCGLLSKADGILVPGGFGDRGIEGKILAARYAREHKIPYLGICLGMQIAVIEYARSILGYADAHSSEFNPDSTHPVIALMPDQRGNIPKGGTMRLGTYPCVVSENTRLHTAYKNQHSIAERHRHRYEFNNTFRQDLVDKGLVISGTSPDGTLVEAIELTGHPFFVGVQYHPEFKSRPNRPHPIFSLFIASSLGLTS